ncbi:hypothetical protein QR680_013856 [Steinernema hermaphroditum]|uniref:Uncharacterized protein n=1 Tax=Steinernema hermaphroditum TaxID=289476 RepID=A0AA39M374_9BILA|nr:hypothetical protein QR680_013856 [Steinernema hermaphroditum]
MVLGSALTRATCGENEILADGTQWEHSCETEIIDDNFKADAGKCICAEGLVRGNDEKCVTRKECEKQLCDALREAPFESDSSESQENSEFPQCREGESCAVIKVKIVGNFTEPPSADRWSFVAGCF